MHTTFCHRRDSQSITADLDLHIIEQALVSQKSLSKPTQKDKSKYKNLNRQIWVENTVSMTIKVLWQIQVANNGYKNK